ncbi:putative metallo-hydrolase YycJ [compost metagenome]
MTIIPFETSHDAAEPCGFNIISDDKTLTFATDLGFVSDKNLDYMKNSDFIVLESNYDLAMLNYGPYPYNLKRRIQGNLGHLSNDDTASTILSLAKNNNKTDFLLAHLSENNNMIDIAKQTIELFISQNDIDINNMNINFATKTLSNEVYSVC